MKHYPSVELGDSVKDRITGFAGVVTGKVEYLYGCKKVLVSPQTLEKGKPAETQWFDEDSVRIVKAGAVGRPESVASRAGGPVAFLPPAR